MIRNREELVSMANDWVNVAKEDLRNKIVSFMEEVGASAEELAHVLAISNAEIQQIINGNGEISLSTFAKLLIATDNVLEIKPLGETPFEDMEDMPDPRQMPMQGMRQMPFGRMPMNEPRMGGMPMPHMGVRPMGGMPMPRMEVRPKGGMPFNEEAIADTHEAMRSQKPLRRASRPNVAQAPQRVNAQPIPFDELGKRELANLIVKNHWDREIDVNSSSRGELIDFLDFKTSMPMPEMPSPREMHRQMARPMMSQTPKGESDEEVERITELLKKEVARNPQLRNLVKKYL